MEGRNGKIKSLQRRRFLYQTDAIINHLICWNVTRRFLSPCLIRFVVDFQAHFLALSIKKAVNLRGFAAVTCKYFVVVFDFCVFLKNEVLILCNPDPLTHSSEDEGFVVE